MVDIFARIAETTDAEFIVRVSFVEIFKAWSALDGCSCVQLQALRCALALSCSVCVQELYTCAHAATRHVLNRMHLWQQLWHASTMHLASPHGMAWVSLL